MGAMVIRLNHGTERVRVVERRAFARAQRTRARALDGVQPEVEHETGDHDRRYYVRECRRDTSCIWSGIEEAEYVPSVARHHDKEEYRSIAHED